MKFINGLIGSFKESLRNLRAGKILNRIGAGKRAFFENPREGIVFKYLPGEVGKLSKYFVRPYGRHEYEIDSNSRTIIAAVLEGKPISKAKYESYSFRKSDSWNFEKFTAPEPNRAVGT